MCMTFCISVGKCSAMKTMRSKAALEKSAKGYGDVLCLRKSDAVKSNKVVESSARKQRQGCGDVLCLRECSAVKSNTVVESSARKQKQSGVCMRGDLVGDAVVMAGKSGSSARRRVWFWGCMLGSCVHLSGREAVGLRGRRWWQRCQMESRDREVGVFSAAMGCRCAQRL